MDVEMVDEERSASESSRDIIARLSNQTILQTDAIVFFQFSHNEPDIFALNNRGMFLVTDQNEPLAYYSK